jgi:hypothetical protein
LPGGLRWSSAACLIISCIVHNVTATETFLDILSPDFMMVTRRIRNTLNKQLLLSVSSPQTSGQVDCIKNSSKHRSDLKGMHAALTSQQVSAVDIRRLFLHSALHLNYSPIYGQQLRRANPHDFQCCYLYLNLFLFLEKWSILTSMAKVCLHRLQAVIKVRATASLFSTSYKLLRFYCIPGHIFTCLIRVLHDAFPSDLDINNGHSILHRFEYNFVHDICLKHFLYEHI